VRLLRRSTRPRRLLPRRHGLTRGWVISAYNPDRGHHPNSERPLPRLCRSVEREVAGQSARFGRHRAEVLWRCREVPAMRLRDRYTLVDILGLSRHPSRLLPLSLARTQGHPDGGLSRSRRSAPLEPDLEDLGSCLRHDRRAGDRTLPHLGIQTQESLVRQRVPFDGRASVPRLALHHAPKK
jgi:hypothetical protein